MVITQSQNGWIVIHEEVPMYSREVLPIAYSFNSLEKALAHIRRRLGDWHPKPQFKKQ